MKNITCYILFFLLVFLTGNSVFSQKLSSGIDMKLDSIIVLNVGLSTLDVRLDNHMEIDFEGHIDIVLPQGLYSLGETRIPIHLSAGKKRFLSIKLRSTALSSLNNKHFTVSLLDQQKKKVLQRAVNIEVPQKRSVIVQDNSELQYLRHVGDSVYINLRVFNSGTTDEQIRLVFSSPDRMGDREFQSVPVILTSGRDTMIRRSFPVEKYMLQLAQYTVRVSGIYENNDVFGNTTVVFPNIASNRNYSQMFNMEGYPSSYSRNYIDLQLDHNIGGTQIYNLRSEGTYRLMDGKLRYSMFANQWGTQWDKPNFNNTYIEYERANKTWTLGNIQESLEAPFYGRGVKFALRDTARHNLLSVGVVEKSNDLLGLYSYRNPGLTSFVNLILADQDPDRKRYEGQLYFDDNRMDTTGSFLWANTFDLLKPRLADKIQIRGFLGGGINYFSAEPMQENIVKPSAALGVRLTGNSKQWTYASDNFFSTPYYTGNRRGALQFMQRLNRSVRKSNYGIGILYSSYKPEYINPRFSPYTSSLTKVDLSINKPLSTFVGINIQPSYNREKADYWGQSDRINLSTDSWQVLSSANIRSKNYKHGLFVTVESGLISIDDRLKDYFIFKSNFSYNYGNFGAFGLFQQGAFQIFEILNSRLLNQPFGTRTSFGASYSGTIIQKRLSWNTNISTSLTTNFGNTYTASIGSSYRIWKNTLLTGTFQYNYTDGRTGYQYDFANVRIGIRQNLKDQNLDRPTVYTGNLKIFCYYDHNNNERFDEGDEVAVGYGFMIRDIYFVTDRNGQSVFKKMPYGEYMLFLPTYNGYRGVSRSISIHTKSVEIAIPLQKVSVVKGRLYIDYDEKLSLDADLSLDRYTIIAQDKNERLFEVHTDRRGEFEFSLPQGQYTFSIKEGILPLNIYLEDNVRSAIVEIGKTVELKPFQLKVRTKKVEVKRFGKD